MSVFSATLSGHKEKVGSVDNGGFSGASTVVRSVYERRPPLTRKEVLVFALILAFGAAAFFFHQRASDFIGEDVSYADCACSLLNQRFYGIHGVPETNQPPGLSAFLAILFSTFGYSYTLSLQAMAVLETLGFVAAYWLMRRRLPKYVAAAICILLISSPVYFSMATRGVWPCFPFFFTTMTALVAFEEYENAATRTHRILWILMLATAVASSLMFASAAVALVAAMVVAVGAAFLKGAAYGRVRLAKVIPILVVGIVVQGWWMYRKPAPLEWSLPGYPRPYLQQLKVKSGNYPELGLATPRDISVRVVNNVLARSDLVTELVFRHGVNPSRMSIVIVPAVLVILGWSYSMWQSGGEDFLGWYFAIYELIYLLWPWKVVYRFVLPIAPLACLYAWRGIKAARTLAVTKPRVTGIVGFPLGIVAAVFGWYGMHIHPPKPVLSRFADQLTVPIWLLLAACAAWMAYTGRPLSLLVPSSKSGEWLKKPLKFCSVSPWSLLQYVSWGFVLVLVAIGVRRDVAIARENVRFPDMLFSKETSINSMALELESARWIQENTPLNAVIMARHVAPIYHYTGRKMIWFAPTSNPDVLMKGIVSHNVDYIVVIKHAYPYYLPDDDYCFNPLLAKYSHSFRMVFRDSDLRIFQIEKTTGNASQVETASVRARTQGDSPLLSPLLPNRDCSRRSSTSLAGHQGRI